MVKARASISFGKEFQQTGPEKNMMYKKKSVLRSTSAAGNNISGISSYIESIYLWSCDKNFGLHPITVSSYANSGIITFVFYTDAQ